MKKLKSFLFLFLFLASFLTGTENPEKPAYVKDQWVSEVRLGGAYQLRGKGFALLSTPEGNFWVSEGRSAAGYKLIELTYPIPTLRPHPKRRSTGMDRTDRKLCHASALLEVMNSKTTRCLGHDSYYVCRRRE